MAKFIVGMQGEEAYQAEADDLCSALGAMMNIVVDAGNLKDIQSLSEEVHELEISCILSAIAGGRFG